MIPAASFRRAIIQALQSVRTGMPAEAQPLIDSALKQLSALPQKAGFLRKAIGRNEGFYDGLALQVFRSTLIQAPVSAAWKGNNVIRLLAPKPVDPKAAKIDEIKLAFPELFPENPSKSRWPAGKTDYDEQANHLYLEAKTWEEKNPDAGPAVDKRRKGSDFYLKETERLVMLAKLNQVTEVQRARNRKSFGHEVTGQDFFSRGFSRDYTSQDCLYGVAVNLERAGDILGEIALSSPPVDGKDQDTKDSVESYFGAIVCLMTSQPSSWQQDLVRVHRKLQIILNSPDGMKLDRQSLFQA